MGLLFVVVDDDDRLFGNDVKDCTVCTNWGRLVIDWACTLVPSSSNDARCPAGTCCCRRRRRRPNNPKWFVYLALYRLS